METVHPTQTRFHTESNETSVSWSAIIGGAFVSGSLALIFILLGIGLGLSVISPWSGEGVSPTTIGVAAVIWLIATHAISSGLGGYLAGRLRTKWSAIDRDEVFFRDTAHGFLVWAVSVMITLFLLGSAVSVIISSGAELAAQVDVGQMTGQMTAPTGAEGTQAAEEARTTTRNASLWIFLALLTGAFCASFAATLGGKQRDDVPDYDETSVTHQRAVYDNQTHRGAAV
jgi:multidrug efflux pump subunit AcrB